MLRAILNPGKVSNISTLRFAVEKWEEQRRAYERKKDSNGLEEKLPEAMLMATLESMCPSSVEAHLRLNHARLQTYALLRTEVLMLLEINIGASLKRPKPQREETIRWIHLQ
eukprot:5342135-Amphidinium_carterae.1